jgi:DNA-binding NarL/FixJ family response regulator
MLANLREELANHFDIVGTANNGLAAVESVRRLNPDVLVMNIAMPEQNGIEVARHLRSIRSRTKILFLTIHKEPEYISAAFELVPWAT